MAEFRIKDDVLSTHYYNPYSGKFRFSKESANEDDRAFLKGIEDPFITQVPYVDTKTLAPSTMPEITMPEVPGSSRAPDMITGGCCGAVGGAVGGTGGETTASTGSTGSKRPAEEEEEEDERPLKKQEREDGAVERKERRRRL